MLRDIGSKMFKMAEITFEVTQDHWRWRHSNRQSTYDIRHTT